VLLADDYHDSESSMAELLRLSGCEVHCCYTAWAVLPRAQQFEPDVCIINVQLPIFNVVKIAPLLRALAGDRLLLLIALIGCESLKVQEKPDDFDYHILNPNHADQLYEKFLKLILEWDQTC
jgi:DNA-binding response OmpR family regulator